MQHHCHFKTKHKCPQKLWHTFSHTPFWCSKLIRITFSLDLRKPCGITVKNLSSNLKKCSVLEEIESYIISNRMRSMHLYIRSELGISCFDKEGFCKSHPKIWESFLLIPSPTWDEFSFLGMWYHLSLRGPIRLTNYNFHACVQYCITIHYHSCIIDKYRNVDGPKCHNNERLRISCFEKEGYYKSHPKSWESFLHIPSPTWDELRIPLC